MVNPCFYGIFGLDYIYEEKYYRQGKNNREIIKSSRFTFTYVIPGKKLQHKPICPGTEAIYFVSRCFGTTEE